MIAFETPRGHCYGHKCTCRNFMPVPGTEKAMWPPCGTTGCGHSLQTHQVLAPSPAPV
jgi:hypothetical protein